MEMQRGGHPTYVAHGRIWMEEFGWFSACASEVLKGFVFARLHWQHIALNNAQGTNRFGLEMAA